MVNGIQHKFQTLALAPEEEAAQKNINPNTFLDNLVCPPINEQAEIELGSLYEKQNFKGLLQHIMELKNNMIKESAPSSLNQEMIIPKK